MVGLNHDNQLDKLRAAGRLGSAGDPMWNGKMHECCGSKRAYYHREGCKLCTGRLKVRKAKEIVRKEFRDEAGNTVRLNKHINRKNHLLVAAMYAMYLEGPDGKPCTVEEVGRVYKKTRQAVFALFKSRGYPLRSKPKKEFQIFDGRKFTPRHDGYWRATAGDRKQMHVYVWEKANGRLLPAGHGIHHKDLDRANNKIENLVLMTIQEISSKFSPHLNQFTSPTGSRKWKRGRIIPTHENREAQSIRKTKGGRDIHSGALLRKMPQDSDDTDEGYEHGEDTRGRDSRAFRDSLDDDGREGARAGDPDVLLGMY